MNKPKYEYGEMVMIVGAGPKFDCPGLMVELCAYGQLADQNGNPVSAPGFWYMWSRYYPYPVAEEHVFPVGDDYQPAWDDVIWKPEGELVDHR